MNKKSADPNNTRLNTVQQNNQRIRSKEKETYNTGNKTVNKTERSRNQSSIKPERIANTEQQINWFSMVSSNIKTEMHTTGRDKQKV